MSEEVTTKHEKTQSRSVSTWPSRKDSLCSQSKMAVGVQLVRAWLLQRSTDDQRLAKEEREDHGQIAYTLSQEDNSEVE